MRQYSVLTRRPWQEDSIKHRRLSRAVVVAILMWAWGGSAMAQEAPWPTESWAMSNAVDQGVNAQPLEALHQRIQAGDFGNVDRLVVIRNGYVVMIERYPHDYREISRGARGTLGCGEGSCTDSASVHPYNYYHPNYHPYFQGRDVHTLQSVTKSVAATTIGAAIHQGSIASTDVHLLSFFEDYDLARVDPQLYNATLEDLLTMRSGIEWHEQDRPLDSTNTTLQLEFSDDWIESRISACVGQMSLR